MLTRYINCTYGMHADDVHLIVVLHHFRYANYDSEIRFNVHMKLFPLSRYNGASMQITNNSETH